MSNTESSSGRLSQIDALRGIAALSVVWFHYTTRFGQLYPQAQLPWLSFPAGHFGVNLFFMISGFVIFMTLNKTHRGIDFLVSRFSRLYPTYWAAIALTMLVTHTLGLPGRETSISHALVNMLMFHGALGVPHVDGAYWTLEVELIFYCGMALLFHKRQLLNVHLWLIALLGLRWVYFAFEQGAGISLPWVLWRLLILGYLPWFVLGVAVFSLITASVGDKPRSAIFSAALALLTLAVTESVYTFGLAAVLLLVLVGATTGRLKPLGWTPLAWLGSVSYPLYLLHEFLGWSVMLWLMRNGWELNAAIAATFLGVLLLSHIVSRMVEQPAMAWLRRTWRAREQSRLAKSVV